MTDLSSLIERLEKASEGSRDLDYAIADAALGPIKPPFRRGFCHCYTSSIDAALTLVPEGWIWTWNGHSEATVESLNGRFLVEGDREFYGRHQSTAIALCIAALCARSAA